MFNIAAIFHHNYLQSHLVVGGTLEGSLHLWDLREPSSLHVDRYLNVLVLCSLCLLQVVDVMSS